MPRKPGGYKNKAGKRVPGVTTITGRWGDPGGLLYWANQLGLQGINHREVSGKAATAGNACHNLVQCHLEGIALDPKCDDAELVKLGEQGYAAYLEWVKRMDLKRVSTEEDLVSERYQYGGCPDFFGAAGDERVGCDWKCSNSVHLNYIYQVAAYRQLWNENHPEFYVEKMWLLRFEKEFGSFHHHAFTGEQMDLAFAGFVKLRENYELDKRMKSWL